MFIKINEQASGYRRIPFALVDLTDGYTAETGVAFSAGQIKISKNGATESNHAGNVTELGTGDYFYTAATGEVDTMGFLTVKFMPSGCRVSRALAQVVAYNFFAEPLPLTGIYNANLIQVNGMSVITTGTVNANITQLNGAPVLATGTVNANITHLNGASVSGTNSVDSNVVYVSGVPVHLDSFKSGLSLGSGENIYFANVKMERDTANSRNDYSAVWYRNGAIVTSGELSSPTIQVNLLDVTGATLIAQTGMFRASAVYGAVGYTEATNLITVGNPYQVNVRATIDGQPRTWIRIIGRDS